MRQKKSNDPVQPQDSSIQPSYAADNEDDADTADHVDTADDADSTSLPLLDLFRQGQVDLSDDELKDIVQRQVIAELAKTDLATRYNILFLHDDRAIDRLDADRIYRAVETISGTLPILLILNSRGGSPSAAYFIAKICREYSDGIFEVAVPRQAKSAATLICCGADRIHMGSLSELGPIDPQFGQTPALALKYSIEHLADLAGRYPAAAEMFANYLAKSLRLEDMGYYERVAVSATHYAERLLRSRTAAQDSEKAMSELAHRLVYEYKDHGFAIDAREAAELFGTSVVGINTEQYDLANQLYRTFDLLAWIIRTRFNRQFVFTGNAESGCLILEANPSF
jgi:hypothetical protein